MDPDVNIVSKQALNLRTKATVCIEIVFDIDAIYRFSSKQDRGMDEYGQWKASKSGWYDNVVI